MTGYQGLRSTAFFHCIAVNRGGMVSNALVIHVPHTHLPHIFDFVVLVEGPAHVKDITLSLTLDKPFHEVVSLHIKVKS